MESVTVSKRIVIPQRYLVAVISLCQYFLPHKEFRVTSRSNPRYLSLI